MRLWKDQGYRLTLECAATGSVKCSRNPCNACQQARMYMAALREDLQRRLEIQRHEWLDCLRSMRREQRRLEERVQEQGLEISELKIHSPA